MMESCALCSQPFSDSDGSSKYHKLLYGKATLDFEPPYLQQVARTIV